jgi:dTDP-glucose pyrophosphorylase
MGMKALVPAAGRGDRLEDRTAESNKCMLTLLGKPLIQYSLENAVTAGVEQIVIVVGYRAEDIINHFGTSFRDTPVRYVIQLDRKGLVHAIACAERAIGGADFMLFLADEILAHPAHPSMLKVFRDEALFGVCGVVVVADRSQIRKTYAILGEETTGRIFRLIEKPRTPINDVMGTGNCILRADIYGYIERTPTNVERGQKELPDLIQCAVDEGKLVKYMNIGDGYININTPDDIGIAERLHGTKLGII